MYFRAIRAILFAQKRKHSTTEDVMDREELRRLVEHYFHLGFENQVIVDFLNNRHAARLSLATLKRRLRDYGLSRRGLDVGDQERREISGPGELGGYRAVWHSLRLNHHIHVPRVRVANILRELNPAGTRERRRRRLARRRYTSYGPNFCWHVDGTISEVQLVHMLILPACRAV